LKEEAGVRETAILDTLEKIAKEKNVKVAHVALAWIRQKHQHSTLTIVSILGAKNVAQLDDNLASLSVTLSDQQLEELNGVSEIVLGSPHDTLANTQIRMIYGLASGKLERKLPVK
jgi:aryl-alcohol dehydrogenase-like predicted oxidoreductase